MFDSHTHLDYIDDPASARAELGLTGMVCIGANLTHARNAVALAEQFADVWATVGLHPTDTDEDSPEVRAGIEALLDHPRVVGVGESGLDDYWDDSKRAAQVRAFEWQLGLARQSGKPLVIHTRDKAGRDSAHRGVMDMLRYHEFTIGWAWASDYGRSDDAEMFDALHAYSPVHNLREGVKYPATLVTTGDHDDRVVPAHSYKFISELQRVQQGDNPTIIRIQVNTGHGAGKPTALLIEEWADVWSFLEKYLK